MTRKYSTRKSINLPSLKELYYKTTHGSSVPDAARSLGLEVSAAGMAVKYIRKYIPRVLANDVKKHSNRRYVEAAKWAVEQDNITRANIKKTEEDMDINLPEELTENEAQEVREAAPMVAIMSEPVNRYTKLELATAVYMDQVQAFIAEEVKSQVGEVVAENQSLKAAMDGARLTNWTQALKSKFDK